MPGLRLSPTIEYGFNGAMPFQAWIPARTMTRFFFVSRLQWGHALSGMDIAELGLPIPKLLKLQWGHALSCMDTARFSAGEFNILWLQWGHALSGMDTQSWH